MHARVTRVPRSSTVGGLCVCGAYMSEGLCTGKRRVSDLGAWSHSQEVFELPPSLMPPTISGGVWTRQPDAPRSPHQAGGRPPPTVPVHVPVPVRYPHPAPVATSTCVPTLPLPVSLPPSPPLPVSLHPPLPLPVSLSSPLPLPVSLPAPATRRRPYSL